MDNNLKILFTGDIYIENESDSILSEELKAIIKAHQYSVCNFEGGLRTPHTKPIRKAGPHLKQNSKAAEVVISDGFNIINLANNHICDFGQKSLENTLDSFKNVITLGAGVNFNNAYAAKYITFNNARIGLFSFCESEFGAITDKSQKQGGYAWVNHPSVNNLIKEAKNQCDFLIVLVHAGIEQIDYPLPEWRQRFYELLDLGADTIIGCHVHVPQGWELYKEKPIFYSMGNFFFDLASNHPYWDKGYCISLTFQDKIFKGFEIIPITKRENKVFIENDILYSDHLSNLCKILNASDYIEKIDKISLKLWEKRYKKYFVEAMGWLYYKFSWKDILSIIKCRIQNKPFNIKPNVDFNIQMLLHNIRIESHRWIILRALKLLDEKDKK